MKHPINDKSKCIDGTGGLWLEIWLFFTNVNKTFVLFSLRRGECYDII